MKRYLRISSNENPFTDDTISKGGHPRFIWVSGLVAECHAAQGEGKSGSHRIFLTVATGSFQLWFHYPRASDFNGAITMKLLQPMREHRQTFRQIFFLGHDFFRQLQLGGGEIPNALDAGAHH